MWTAALGVRIVEIIAIKKFACSDVKKFYDWNGKTYESICGSYCGECPGLVLVGKDCFNCFTTHYIDGNGAFLANHPAALSKLL